MTLLDATTVFIQNLHDIGLSPNTISSYNTDLKQFVKQIGPQTKLDTLTYPLMSEFFSYLHTKKLAHASLKRKRVVIQRFLTFCYEKRLCLENHAVLIDPMRTKQTSKPKDILNSKEISVILSYLDKQVEMHRYGQGIKEINSLFSNLSLADMGTLRALLCFSTTNIQHFLSNKYIINSS